MTKGTGVFDLRFAKMGTAPYSSKDMSCVSTASGSRLPASVSAVRLLLRDADCGFLLLYQRCDFFGMLIAASCFCCLCAECGFRLFDRWCGFWWADLTVSEWGIFSVRTSMFSFLPRPPVVVTLSIRVTA